MDTLDALLILEGAGYTVILDCPGDRGWVKGKWPGCAVCRSIRCIPSHMRDKRKAANG